MSDRDAFRANRDAGLKARHETRLVKVLTETAGEAGRRIGWKAAGEEIALECERKAAMVEASSSGDRLIREGLARGYRISAEVARMVGRSIASQPPQATSDATSGVPGHPEVSEAVRSPQEPGERS